MGAAKFWLGPVRLAANEGFKKPELHAIGEIIEKHEASCFAHGIKLNNEPKIQDVMTTDDHITVSFDDGRILSFPLKWYPRLLRATPAQRRNWKLLGRGMGVHWPDVDEDLSAEGFLKGWPTREYLRSLARTENKQKIAA